jgi:hypothetical protein
VFLPVISHQPFFEASCQLRPLKLTPRLPTGTTPSRFECSALTLKSTLIVKTGMFFHLVLGVAQTLNEIQNRVERFLSKIAPCESHHGKHSQTQNNFFNPVHT